MKVSVIISFLGLFIFELKPVNAAPPNLNSYIKSRWDLSSSQKNYLLEGKILADSEVESKDANQEFDMQVMAYHPKKCRRVIRKLSLFESYKDWIDFIQESTYQEKSNLLTIRADHPLLPFPMLVHILVERPTKPGKYTFSFPTGIFKGLTGYFEVLEFNNRCLFYAKSHWKGKKTRIPGFIIEIFSETLSMIGGATLMRKSM